MGREGDEGGEKKSGGGGGGEDGVYRSLILN